MMRTLASLALFAAGATAQVIDSSSFGAGKTLVSACSSRAWIQSDLDQPGYHQTETTQSRDGQLEERATNRTW